MHRSRQCTPKTYVGIHEGNGHGDRASIWEHKIAVLAEFLDDTEDVVPATTVQARAVISQLVDDLIHLKGSKDSLDQHSASDCAAAHANIVLSEVEDVIPETGLEMRLHLWKVEIRAKALLDALACIVEEVQTKIK